MDVSSQGAIRFQGIWGQGKISAYQMRGGAGFPHLASPIPLPRPCPRYQVPALSSQAAAGGCGMCTRGLK